MSVVVEFTVDWDAFALGQALTRPEGVDIELERVVPTPNTVLPFFWASGIGAAELAESVEVSTYVENLTALDRAGDATLYRVEWAGEYEDLLEGIVETDATILEATGGDVWLFRLRFLDHDHVTAFHDYCTAHDITIDVKRMYSPTDRDGDTAAFDLTASQHEAVALALEHGYFATPREVTMDALAADLGISQQAFSNRLRRGTEKVLSKALLVDGTAP